MAPVGWSESAAFCWADTTMGLYDCLNVPFFVRCASLGPDNGWFSIPALPRPAPSPWHRAVPHPAPSRAPSEDSWTWSATEGHAQGPTSHFERCYFELVGNQPGDQRPVLPPDLERDLTGVRQNHVSANKVQENVRIWKHDHLCFYVDRTIAVFYLPQANW